jgi:hypothetical protein
MRGFPMSPTAWLVWAFVISAVSFASGYQLAKYFERDRADRSATALRRAREARAAAQAAAETAQQWVNWLLDERAMVRAEREALKAERQLLRALAGAPGCRMTRRLGPTARLVSNVRPRDEKADR